MIFVDVLTSGIARTANAVQFTMRKDDPPTFQKGFYLIKLGDNLEDASDVEAIEGVIFHELAHRILEHLSSGKFSCDMEREANRLVKKWGFEKEYTKASGEFGHKEPGDSPCHDQENS